MKKRKENEGKQYQMLCEIHSLCVPFYLLLLHNETRRIEGKGREEHIVKKKSLIILSFKTMWIEEMNEISLQN